MVPKLFGPIRERYLERPGGYTRVLRIEPLKEDQAESAILELVDGPKDLRFAMTAKTLSRLPEEKKMNEITAKNVQKVTRYRKEGMNELREMIGRMRIENEEGWDDRVLAGPRKVYPQEQDARERHFPDVADAWKQPNPPKKTAKATQKPEKAASEGKVVTA